jgi:hypothetical protein
MTYERWLTVRFMTELRDDDDDHMILQMQRQNLKVEVEKENRS